MSKQKADTSSVAHVLTSSLAPDPQQPRRAFDDKALQALAASIGERGILQPILVRPHGDGLMIVDGERRWRAAKLAGLETVPTLRVSQFAEPDQLLLDQVSVNELRVGLRPMELARVLRGMIDARKTANEIAATLTKQGHAGMTAAKIKTAAALVDLPDWVQQMIDRDEIEPSAAQKLLPVLKLPGMDKELKKELQQTVGYTGKLDTREVLHDVEGALADTFDDLTRTDSWAHNAVHFDWKARCKSCEHLFKFEDGAYCMNKKLFKQHNDEAKAEGLLPGGKRPAKKVAASSSGGGETIGADLDDRKAEQRERSLKEKVRDYLHAYLARELQGVVARSPELGTVLVVWAALKKPGTVGERGAPGVHFGGEPGAGAAASQNLRGLEDLVTGGKETLWNAEAAAAQEIICDLPWRETHALARHLWSTLDQVWKIDADFLDLFRKDELVHMAVNAGCDPGNGRLWDRMKGADMKAALVQEREKLARPAVLTDLYEGEIEPAGGRYRHWNVDDEEGDDFGDDEEETTADEEAA